MIVIYGKKDIFSAIPTRVVGFLQCKLTERKKNHFACRLTCSVTGIHYPDSKSISLCSYSLLLHA